MLLEHHKPRKENGTVLKSEHIILCSYIVIGIHKVLRLQYNLYPLLSVLFVLVVLHHQDKILLNQLLFSGFLLYLGNDYCLFRAADFA